MNPFPLIVAEGFWDKLPILEIIKAGAAGLAVLLAILAYRLTSEVVKQGAGETAASLAKFSWVCSLLLILVMVAAELIRVFRPPPIAPVLGIQSHGWNEFEFGGSGSGLKVGIWEGSSMPGSQVGAPFEITSNATPYVIRGTSPLMTIHLEEMMAKMMKQKAVTAEAVNKVQELQPHNKKDVGPATAP